MKSLKKLNLKSLKISASLPLRLHVYVDVQYKYHFSPKGWNVPHENYFPFVINIRKVALVYKNVYIFFSYNRLPKSFLDNFATTCMYCDFSGISVFSSTLAFSHVMSSIVTLPISLCCDIFLVMKYN